MDRICKVLIMGCSVFLLCQCAAQDEVRDLSYQIRAVNKKVDEMRGTTVDQMQKKQASSFNRIDDVNDALLQIRSSLEENALMESQFREQTKEDFSGLQVSANRLQAENKRKIQILEGKIQQLHSEMASLKQDRIRYAEKRVQTAARQAEEARRRTVQASSRGRAGVVKIEPDKRKARVDSSSDTSTRRQSRKSVVVASSGTKSGSKQKSTNGSPKQAGDQFGKAVALFNAKKYKEAYSGFEQVLSGNPRGNRAAETLFYMGEALYNQGEYDLAILDYQKVISNHSKHKRKPAALLKQGMSFEKLTDLETAKIIYKKLVSEHPGTPEAKAANVRLGNI